MALAASRVPSRVGRGWVDRGWAIGALLALLVSCGAADTERLDGAGESTAPTASASSTSPSATAPSAPDEDVPPRVGVDHWHAEFALWRCDRFEGPFADLDEATHPDLFGIHSHNDGLIHIHPFAPEAAGANATLGWFTDRVGIGLTDQEMTLPSGESFHRGDACGDQPGVFEVIEWADPETPEVFVVHTSGLRDVRLREDAAYTLAFAEEGTPPGDLAKPPPSVLPEDEAPPDSSPARPLPTAIGTLPCPGDGVVVLQDPSNAVQVRPVLLVVPEELCAAPMVLPSDGTSRYELGPALPSGIVESALAARALDGGWEVRPVLRAGRPGIDDFNELAARCFARDRTCPTGQIAIIWKGRVVSAPMVQAADFERDAIVVSGSLTQNEARALADAFVAPVVPQ